MSNLDHFRAMTAAEVIECLAEDPSVLDVWKNHLSALQTEAATLISDLSASRALRMKAEAEVARLTGAKDGAYTERNLCVALIARMADRIATGYLDGFDAWLAQHDPTDTAWERDWLNIVFVQIPRSRPGGWT